jgi:hypothetical protein
VTDATTVTVPKAWDDRELSDWATPLPVLGARPGFFPETEFNTVPVPKLYRTYPAYDPDHEPPGYWEWLQKQPAKPLLERETLRTERDWIEAGRIVFHELYRPPAGFNANLTPLVRSRASLARAGVKALPDGTLGIRWLVTPEGVMPVARTCQACHTRYLDDKTTIDGAPGNVDGSALQRLRELSAPRSGVSIDRLRAMAYSQWGVPWLKNDIHEVIKSMTYPQIDELHPDDLRFHTAIQARPNGSPFYPTKTLDLNGVRDRKYLDHTATHRNRGVADIMRYALLVECCDPGIFGPYQMFPPQARLPRFRYSDDVLFALASYIYSLEPPPSPYRNHPLAAEGKKIFDGERCGSCHTPPLYTNNKLTLAEGFKPPDDHPYKPDIMNRSVWTDPGLALKTRKGTGFYRVPSLRGVWYRGLFGHHGDVATLEDWFDPARLRDDYVPSGWKGYQQSHRAVPGHEFGLDLSAADKRALIAFLRTL